MDLDRFLALAFSAWPRQSNAHVVEPGFESLYVRFNLRYVSGRVRGPVLDLASITAKHPGQGAFKALVARIRTRYPGLDIYVENVLSPRFAAGLAAMGFARVGPGPDACFLLDGDPDFPCAPKILSTP